MPATVRPQECRLPALRLPNTSPPATAAGLALHPPTGNCEGHWSGAVATPAPSWPSSFNPQQYAAPLVVMPQVCRPPAVIAEKVSPPLTATGTELTVIEPSPSSPVMPSPQQ